MMPEEYEWNQQFLNISVMVLILLIKDTDFLLYYSSFFCGTGEYFIRGASHGRKGKLLLGKISQYL